MSDIASTALAAPKSGFLSRDGLTYAALGGGVVGLVGLILVYGYPLLITLAVSGAFLGLTMIVVLTGLDLVRSGKSSAKRRA